MKLKTILGIVAAACATFVMSVAACAATDVKVGDITKAGSYVVVPIVLSSTEMPDLTSYDLTINFDSSKFTAVRVVDSLKYTDPIFGEEATYGSITSNVNYADGQVRFNWYWNNADLVYPYPSLEGFELAKVYFSTTESNYSSSDFRITANMVADKAETSFECKSFFTFDVTGDLGGNEVVALGASTDGGVTIQPLNYYTSTDWIEGTDYADATTTFLVSVKNTTSDLGVADVTIYGELSDGTYVPLSAYNQSNLLVQKFD